MAPLRFLWTILPNPIPRRYRRRIRSRLRSSISPTSTIARVETSFDPAESIRALRRHRWSYHDGHYLILIILGIFALSISQAPGPLVKTGAASLLMLALLMPITRQFFLPFLPSLTWLIFFFNARFIPAEYRPHIWVKVLPALENIFYGANLSNIMSAHQYVILDVLAWIPYGIIHFGGPVVWAGIMFLFAPPGTVPVFARTFGYVNIVGVLIQLCFPCSPPWYENLYGLAPANYSMEGSPAGLARIDALFGFDMYTTNFTASPLVFGAFPSLHSANAVLEALFMSYCFPSLRPFCIAYAMWMWWATMYLSHHYAVDLVAGGIIAAVAFYVVKAKWLPRVQHDKVWRWEYDYVDVGEGGMMAEGMKGRGKREREREREYAMAHLRYYPGDGLSERERDRERDPERNRNRDRNRERWTKSGAAGPSNFSSVDPDPQRRMREWKANVAVVVGVGVAEGVGARVRGMARRCIVRRRWRGRMVRGMVRGGDAVEEMLSRRGEASSFMIHHTSCTSRSDH